MPPPSSPARDLQTAVAGNIEACTGGTTIGGLSGEAAALEATHQPGHVAVESWSLDDRLFPRYAGALIPPRARGGAPAPEHTQYRLSVPYDGKRTSRRQLSRHHGRLRRRYSSNPDSFAFSRHLLRGANTLHFDHPSGQDRVDTRVKRGWLEDYTPPPLSAGFDARHACGREAALEADGVRTGRGGADAGASAAGLAPAALLLLGADEYVSWRESSTATGLKNLAAVLERRHWRRLGFHSKKAVRATMDDEATLALRYDGVVPASAFGKRTRQLLAQTEAYRYMRESTEQRRRETNEVLGRGESRVCS